MSDDKTFKMIGSEGILIAIEVLKEHGMTQEQAERVLYDMQAKGVTPEYNDYLVNIVREGKRS
jgi:hypothetical protein